MIHFFYSLIAFIIALFFIMLGILGLLVQISDSIRSDVIGFIIEDTLILSLFGIACILIGCAIVFYLLTGFKKRYFKIRSKDNNAFYLDESLFQDYMKNYWKQLFPKQDVPNQVVLKKNKVLITADLPYVPEAQQKTLLSRIDRDLKEMFTRLLGYRQEYVISISFQSEPEVVKPTK
jgi:hypothetical protein